MPRQSDRQMNNNRSQEGSKRQISEETRAKLSEAGKKGAAVRWDNKVL